MFTPDLNVGCFFYGDNCDGKDQERWKDARIERVFALWYNKNKR